MSDAPDNTMDQKLADALSADDVAGELANLPQTEQVARMRSLHDQLSALRGRIDARVYPGPAWTAPPARQPLWKLAFRAAGLVAAAGIALAVVLYLADPQPAGPPATDDHVASTAPTRENTAAILGENGLPSISPADLPGEAFNLSVPSLSWPTVDTTGWTMPAISLPTIPIQDKEHDHES